MVSNFVCFRTHHERETGARMPRSEQAALMAPPRRALREQARQQRRLKVAHKSEHAHGIAQVEVTLRLGVSSQASFCSSEEEEDDGFMEDLGEDELNDHFEEGELEAPVGLVTGLNNTKQMPRIGSWSNLGLPGESGHSYTSYGNYGDLSSHGSKLLPAESSHSMSSGNIL